MKKAVVILLVFFLFFGLAYSENISAPNVIYCNQKDKTVAALFSIILPSAGHAYAENWGRGMLFVAGETIIIGSIAYGYKEVAKLKSNDNKIYNAGQSNLLFGLGYASLIGLRIWEIIDATKEVDKYNFDNTPSYTFGVSPNIDNGLSLTLQVNF